MNKIVLVICWLLPAALFAQKNVEKPFQYFDNWEQVLSEAKTNQKKIFIDAYITGCPPCKQMDKDVYSNDTVIRKLDSNFIAIKVQMDRKVSDLSQVKSWYKDAEMLSKKFKVTSFPTLIFLDPNGEVIIIEKGYQPVDTFLNTIKFASQPENSFANQLARYRSGKTPSNELLKLALKAKEYNMDSLALTIAGQYKHDYLDKQAIETIFTPELLSFLVDFEQLISLDDRIVSYSYSNPKTVDSLLQRKGIAQMIVEVFVDRRMIQPTLSANKEPGKDPNWKGISNELTRRYDKQTAHRIITNQKIGYYRKNKEWDKQAKYEIEKIEFYGLDTAGIGKTAVNNLMFNLFFKYIENPLFLKKAIRYMETILTSDPDRDAWIDTYANLLYKVGDKHNAIQNEQKALAIAEKHKYDSRVEEYNENLKKMLAGQPTWSAGVQ